MSPCRWLRKNFIYFVFIVWYSLFLVNFILIIDTLTPNLEISNVPSLDFNTTLKSTSDFWNWKYAISNYTFTLSCPILSYTSLMSEEDNVIAYTQDNNLFSGDGKILATFNQIKNNSNCGNITIFSNNSNDNNNIITVKCYYTPELKLSFYGKSKIMTATYINNNWIISIYYNIDLRIYGMYLFQYTNKVILSGEMDTCNNYFTYSSGFIIIVFVIFLAYCIFWCIDCCTRFSG
jgi:hypothetical protein